MPAHPLTAEMFFWVLSTLCAVHRKLYCSTLAQQQQAAPYTLERLQSALTNYGLGSARVRSHPKRLQFQTFPLLAWFGQLDIIASAEGKLVPQTLVKIVQPAESGVVKQLLVAEGDTVKAGQVLARLDPTIAAADKNSVAQDLAVQRLQQRRLQAQLADQPMLPKAGDDAQQYAKVHSQYLAHRQAFADSLEQERSLLIKAQQEHKSASQILAKLEQTLPTYQKAAAAYVTLQQQGLFSGLAAEDKQREAIEKAKDRDAQQSTVAALGATIAAQEKRISQLHSAYRSELQRELAGVRANITQLQPALDKNAYREGLLELKAPQDGRIKDLATTTVGAVVQPGTVLMSLVPDGEELFADVSIKNDDTGFVQVGQSAQVKLAAYPFQKYGMLTGTVTKISADAAATGQESGTRPGSNAAGNSLRFENTSASIYQARIKLSEGVLIDAHNNRLLISSGMQIVAEINQGRRTVLEYLLSPVQRAVKEAGRER